MNARAAAGCVALAVLAACAAPRGASGGATGDTAGDTSGERDELRSSAGTLVARLVHAPHDPAAHAATCKPWHQLFAPDGRQLTKDLGGTYEHHRGVFVGWNQVKRGGRTFDFWHCRGGEVQRVVRVEAQPGPGAAQVVHVDWCAGDGSVVLHEERRVLVRDLGLGSVSCELTSTLRAAGDASAPADGVQLGGDPHHAGCHVRAVQTFAEPGAVPVGYVRPASARALRDDTWADCAWLAAVLPFPDGPVTVLRVEHPGNPAAVWSARAYGRFGAMSTATLTAAKGIELRWAYVVAAGERDAAWCERAAAAAFGG